MRAERRVLAFTLCVSEDSLKEVTSKQPRKRRVREQMFQKQWENAVNKER